MDNATNDSPIGGVATSMAGGATSFLAARNEGAEGSFTVYSFARGEFDGGSRVPFHVDEWDYDETAGKIAGLARDSNRYFTYDLRGARTIDEQPCRAGAFRVDVLGANDVLLTYGNRIERVSATSAQGSLRFPNFSVISPLGAFLWAARRERQYITPLNPTLGDRALALYPIADCVCATYNNFYTAVGQFRSDILVFPASGGEPTSFAPPDGSHAISLGLSARSNSLFAIALVFGATDHAVLCEYDLGSRRDPSFAKIPIIPLRTAFCSEPEVFVTGTWDVIMPDGSVGNLGDVSSIGRQRDSIAPTQTALDAIFGPLNPAFVPASQVEIDAEVGASSGADLDKAIHSLRARIEELGFPSPRCAVDRDIERALRLGFHADLIDYYRVCEPDDCLEMDVRLWSIENAIIENTDAVPGCALHPNGHTVFASNYSGDAYCIEGEKPPGSAPIWLVPHDQIGEDGTRDAIESYRVKVASSLAEFLTLLAEGEIPA